MRILLACGVLFAGCTGSTFSPDKSDGGLLDSGVVDAGAPDAGWCEGLGTYGCPGDLGHFCRLNGIVNRYASPCTGDADCTLAAPIESPPNCQGWGVCDGERPAVLVSQLNAFRADAEAEMHSYCDGLGCMGGPSCAPMDAGVACVQGVCKRTP